MSRPVDGITRGLSASRAITVSDILQDANDATHFVLYEAYASAADAKAHKETPHYAAWRDAVADMMAAPREGQPFVGLFPGTD